MRNHTLALINLLFLSIISGCTGNPIASETPGLSTPIPVAATATPQPAEPTRLNLAYGNLPAALDPHRTSDQYATEVLNFVCQGLIGSGNENILTEDWKYEPENRSLTFYLRKDIQFSDGSPLNAEAVVYSLQRLQEPEAEVSPLYETFQGVEIEAVDDYTVLLKFDTPHTDLLELLGTNYASIISPLADKSGVATQPICTGPYFVKEFLLNEYILLAKNTRHNSAPSVYENQGPPYIDEIKIYLIKTHEERIQALLDGVIDMNNLNTKDDVEKIKQRSDDFRLTPGNWLGGITYLGFNYVRPPVNDLKVRQALAHAIDKNGVIDAVLADEFAIPAVSLFAPQVFGYSETLAEAEYKFDLEKSRQMLSDAGFADSDGDGIFDREGRPLNLLLLTTGDNIYLDMATFIQKSFAKIGVDIEIKQATRTEIAEITPTGEFDLLLYDYSWPDPSALELFLGSAKIGTTNRVAYSNPEVDALLAEISQLATNPENDAVREQKIIEAQRLIILDVPWQPILARRVISAINVRVSGTLWQDARIVDK